MTYLAALAFIVVVAILITLIYAAVFAHIHKWRPPGVADCLFCVQRQPLRTAVAAVDKPRRES